MAVALAVFYPSESEVATFGASPTDLSAVLTWANIPDGDVQSKVLKALGDPLDLSDVAGLAEDSVGACLAGLETQAGASAILISRVKRFYSACRRTVGIDAPAPAAAPPLLALAPPPGAAPPPSVKQKRDSTRTASAPASRMSNPRPAPSQC